MAEHGVACHQNFCSCLHYSRDGIQADAAIHFNSIVQVPLLS